MKVIKIKKNRDAFKPLIIKWNNHGGNVKSIQNDEMHVLSFGITF